MGFDFDFPILPSSASGNLHNPTRRAFTFSCCLPTYLSLSPLPLSTFSLVFASVFQPCCLSLASAFFLQLCSAIVHLRFFPEPISPPASLSPRTASSGLLTKKIIHSRKWVNLGLLPLPFPLLCSYCLRNSARRRRRGELMLMATTPLTGKSWCSG